MSNVYIIDGARTPIGAYLGQYKKIESVDLGINCVKGLLDRNPIIQKKDIEGLVLGQVLTSGLGMNTARQVALGSGMHQSSFAYVINQVCGSGMRAAMDGSSKIFTGESDLLLAGGQESMSRARHAYLTRTGENKLGNNIFIDTLVNDGLTDAFSKEHMGITAENVARKYTVTRQEQDHYSYKSYVKTYKALKNRYFKNELIQSEAGSTNIIMGLGEDINLQNEISVTIIATGFAPDLQQDIIHSEPQKIIHSLDNEQELQHELGSGQIQMFDSTLMKHEENIERKFEDYIPTSDDIKSIETDCEIVKNKISVKINEFDNFVFNDISDDVYDIEVLNYEVVIAENSDSLSIVDFPLQQNLKEQKVLFHLNKDEKIVDQNDEEENVKRYVLKLEEEDEKNENKNLNFLIPKEVLVDIAWKHF